MPHAARPDPPHTERLAVDVPDHPGAVLRVEVHHPGAPRTALFSSGLGLPLDLWYPVVGLLPDVRCVLLDRPGMGGSTPWHRAVGLSEEVALLTVVLDAVHPGAPADPVTVVGHSHGGLYAEALARTRPESVRALVLVDPSDPEHEARSPVQLEGAPGRAVERAAGWPRVATRAAGIAALLVLSGGSLAGAAPRLARDRWRRARGHGRDGRLTGADAALVRAYEQPDQLAATVAELVAVREDARDLLELIGRTTMPDVPVELVVATRGAWPGHRLRRGWLGLMAHRAHALGPGTVTTLADSGHLVMLDAPELLADVVMRAAHAPAS